MEGRENQFGAWTRGGERETPYWGRFAKKDLSRKLEISANKTKEAVFREFDGKGGATLSTFIVDDKGNIASTNVGDSLVYVVLNDGGIGQASTDDTIEGQRSAMKLKSQGWPSGSRGLLQYIGMGDDFEPRGVEIP